MPFFPNDLITSTWANSITDKAVAPTAPTLARSAGQVGNLSLTSALVTSRTPDSATFELIHDWTPTALTTAFTSFVLTPPSGWSVASFAVGSTTFLADGLARFIAMFTALSFYLRNETLNTQRICIVISLVRN